jgi:hypothetical protein
MGQPGFGHAKEKGPDCRQQRRDLAGIGARQSAGVSVDSNGACRGGSGGAAGRGASRWPSRPAWRSPAGRRAAVRRGSPRGIPRVATTGIESTRWRRDRPEVSASTVEPGQRKSAPPVRDAPRRWPCFGHTPTTTAQLLSIGQAIGQVSWSTAVGLPAVAAASGQSDHRRSPPGSPAAGSRRRIPRHKRSAGKDASRWSALGRWSIGNRWSSAGTNGQPRYDESAGQRPIGAPTSNAEESSAWVRTPHPTATVSPLGPDGRQLPIISGQHRQADTQLSERARRSRRSNERSSGSLRHRPKHEPKRCGPAPRRVAGYHSPWRRRWP